MRIILIRHGDPDYAKDSLTEKGFREANLLAERIKNWDITDAYCSPLGRARDTARIGLSKNGATPICYGWLREFWIPIKDLKTGKDRGPWDFVPEDWAVYEEMFSKNNWMQAEPLKYGKVAEEYFKTEKNLDKLLLKYGYAREGNFYRFEQHSDANIVFFCHMGLSFILLSHLLNLPFPALIHGIFLPPTSVTILTTEEYPGNTAYFRAQTIGDTKHLLAGNEPISGSGMFCDIFQK